MSSNYSLTIKSTPMAEIQTFVEILKGSLYFAVIKNKIPNKKLRSNSDLFYFTIDEELVYQNYYNDFGPLNISCLYKFCTKLNKYLQFTQGVKAIVYYTSNLANNKANATFLMGSYCLIYLKMLPKDVMNLMEPIGQLRPFVDASQYICQFTLKMIDCYQAVSKALAINFFNFDDFNDSEYDLYNKFEFGDMNWLVPRKFLAFLGPADIRISHSPEFYIKYFLKNDVKTIIRLNSALYDPSVFVQAGIRHYDLIFPDGTTPPKDVLLKFLYITETAPAAIGVHCKAGLGRTGTLIGAYIMKHYRMTARETIAWLRICRPGSVIGQQQMWMEQIQSWLWRIGSQYRLNHFDEGDRIPRHKYGIYSKLWPSQKQKILRMVRKNLQNTQTQLATLMKSPNSYQSLSIEKFLQNSVNIIKNSQQNLNKKSRMSHNDFSNGTSSVNEVRIFPDEMSEKQRNKTVKYINGDSENSPRSANFRKLRNRPPLKYVSDNSMKSKHTYRQLSDGIMTQGDKLNFIKIHRNGKINSKHNYAVQKQK